MHNKHKGPGRISSTAGDLLKWDKTLYTNKLVKQSTLTEAFKPMILHDGTVSNYGFGWRIDRDAVLGKVVSHSGDNPGYQTRIIRCIDHNKTIILLNNNPYPAFSDFNDIIDAATLFLKNHLLLIIKVGYRYFSLRLCILTFAPLA